MAVQPTRIDLLELDMDIRLAHLWPELEAQVAAGNLPSETVPYVSAFMRAAYGKGYCDAHTEERPGCLCTDHGYRIPPRKRPQRAA